MKILVILILAVLAASPSLAAVLEIGHFSADDLNGWVEKPFRGHTSYSLVTDEGKRVLEAHSVHAASGLIKKVKLKAAEYPLLRWSWKVEHTLKGENVKEKKGDDFAARVYVVFPRTFFWQTRALNYVWAAKMAKGSMAPSPYTSRAVIIAVESGDEKAGKWATEERNIYEDYKKAFGEEPSKIGAVAVMTDTDDTGDEVTAWYGDILLESAPALH